MGSRNGFDSQGDLDELTNVVDRGSGAVSAATRQANALINLGFNAAAPAASIAVKDLDLGASGTAGTLDIFPGTASKGKTSFASTNNTTNTTTAIVVAAQAAARTLTVPDGGATAASFMLTEGAQTINGAQTFAASPILGTGTQVDLASTTGTFSSNAVTITQYAAVLTTESLTTAHTASQALVVTKTGVSAGDIAILTRAGGSNTGGVPNVTSVVCTSNTVTINLKNEALSVNAFNGTFIFNLVIFKA